MTRLFVSGISTDVGKTVVSAVLAKAYQASYWKPFQAGVAEGTDSQEVARLTDGSVACLPEAQILQNAISPHAAAEREGLTLSWSAAIKRCSPLPDNLVIEGAGGLLVPISDNELVVDITKHLECQVVLVVRHYLGSINHTLMSLEIIKSRNLKLWGIVISGDKNEESEHAIIKHSGLGIRLRIAQSCPLNSRVITQLAAAL